MPEASWRKEDTGRRTTLTVGKVIEQCESNLASLINVVKKTNGAWRVFGDFRRLNITTKQTDIRFRH